MPRLLFGEDQLAVGKYVEHAAAAQTKLDSLHSGLLFQFAFQAPGLAANVGSEKTALNVNFHGHPCSDCMLIEKEESALGGNQNRRDAEAPYPLTLRPWRALRFS